MSYASNPYGAPVVRVFNESGTEVIERVTTFSYLHSEKTDDASRITIETPDVSIVDNPFLQEGQVLKVVFGYLGGTFFRAHTIWIWDLSATFSEQGVRLEIIGYCKAAYMKLNSSKDVWNNTGLGDAVDDLAAAYGIGVVKEQGELEGELVSSQQYGGETTAVYDNDTNQVTVARSSTSYVQTPTLLKKWKTMPQGNKSDAKLVDQLADLEPEDNVIVEGRDDNLIIKKRNLNQKPYKAYKYRGEPGYLLEFTPALKNSEARKNATANTVSGWNDETGEYYQAQVSHSQSGAGLLGDIAQVTNEEIVLRGIRKDAENQYDQGKTIDGIFRQVVDREDEEGKPIYRYEKVDKLEATGKYFVAVLKKGTVAATVDLERPAVSAAMDATGRLENLMFIPLNPKEYLPLLADDAKDAVGQGVNRQSKKELELYECNATVIGDPELRSGRVVSILGVGNKYSGNYYIISCDHEISPQNGYRCRLVIAKNAANRKQLSNTIGTEEQEDYNSIEGTAIGAVVNNQVGLPSDGTSELYEVPLKSDL